MVAVGHGRHVQALHDAPPFGTPARVGHKDDPLYRVRRVMLTGIEHLTDRQRARPNKWLPPGDPDSEAEVTWYVCQQVRTVCTATSPPSAARPPRRSLSRSTPARSPRPPSSAGRCASGALICEEPHFVAGHCARGPAVACLIREAWEEAGLRTGSDQVEFAHAVHLADGNGVAPRMQLDAAGFPRAAVGR